MGLICFYAARRQSRRHSDWIHRGVFWHGHEVIAVCLAYAISLTIIPLALTPSLNNTLLNGYEFVIAPLIVALLAILWQLYEYGGRLQNVITQRSIAMACLAWCIVVPIVNGIHLVCNIILHWFNSLPVSHPLTSLAVNESAVKQILFLSSVCVATPLLEELLFRGVIMRWAINRKYGSIIIIGLSGCLSILMTVTNLSSYRLIVTWVIIVVALYILENVYRPIWWSSRIGLGIASSALLFALAHGNVWPTPLPLFIFGLILGYLTARTGTITASVILHGLFNLVSCIMLLLNGG